MMAKRVMGKASFATLQDRSGAIQLFLQQAALGEAYESFKGWDVGDILGAEGTLFKHEDRRAVGQGGACAPAGEVAAAAAGQVARPRRRRARATASATST